MEPRTFLYRTQIHRRTLLGSGALVGLGALLAACGQQANNEAASSTAAPSESASASAAASESPSASATPSTVRGYSGQSKAPTESTVKPTAMGRPRTSLNLMPLKRATARSLLKVSVRRWTLGLNGLIMEFR